MEIRKSQRLSQYLSLISDMVHYSDIGARMVDYGALSINEHELLQSKLSTEGNVSVMNEFLTIINLRSMGFDNFVQVLKKTDYEWIARQLELDPAGTMFIESSSTSSGDGKSARVQNFLANVRQTINRKSESIVSDSGKPNEDELTHMSYRNSCPIEIPINPRYYDEVHPMEDCTQIQSKAGPDCLTDMPRNEVEAQLKNLEVSSSKSESNENVALVENIPGTLNVDLAEKYFEKLAQRLDAPVPSDLKVIKHGKISKHGTRGKRNKVKLEFQSEEARNRFIQTFKEFIGNLQPKDEMYDTASQLNICIPKPKLAIHAKGKGLFRRKWESHKPSSCFSSSSPSSHSNYGNAGHSEKESSKKHWYQRRFSMKTWRPK